MKRSLIVGGSVGAVVLFVLAMFPTVVGAQTTKMTINERIFLIQNSINKKDNEINFQTNGLGSLIELLLAIIGDFVLIFIYGIFYIISQFTP